MAAINNKKIGIDFGTIYSRCGSVKDGIAEIIHYNNCSRFIPSAVYYSPKSEEIIVDMRVKNDMRKYSNSVFGLKRLIGRDYDDPEIRRSACSIVKGYANEALIKIEYNNNIIHLTAEEVTSEIFKKMKQTADIYVDQDPNLPSETVIAVPPYFNNQQRNKTIEAAERSNLRVIKLIDEPLATVIGYLKITEIEREQSNRNEEIILVCDFGAASFDVSIIKVNHERRKIKLISTKSDLHLGGEDINNKLEDYYINLYDEATNRQFNEKKLLQLKRRFELTKMELSCLHYTDVDFDPLEDSGIDTCLTLDKFNEINQEIFDKTMDIIDSVLQEAGMETEDIDIVLPVGGSSKNIKFNELLNHKLSTSKICHNIPLEENITYGATVYANGQCSYEIEL